MIDKLPNNLRRKRMRRMRRMRRKGRQRNQRKKFIISSQPDQREIEAKDSCF